MRARQEHPAGRGVLCQCGHTWSDHDGDGCHELALTEHFEGTDHGGIVPCDCIRYAYRLRIFRVD